MPLSQILLSPDALARLRAGFAAHGPQGVTIYNAILEAVKVGLAQSIHDIFLFSLAAIIFGLIAVLFLKEIPLRTQRPAEAGF